MRLFFCKESRLRTFLFPAVIVFHAWIFTNAANAADTWSTPHPGVRLLQRTTSDPLRIFVLQVDNCARGIAHRATKETERQRTTTSFRNLVGAQAAINGDFFNYTNYFPNGLAIGDGVKWNNDNGTMGFLAAGPDRIFLSPTEAVVSTPEAWMRNAVGGFPTLVRDGVAQYGATSPSHCPERHPRTAVGLSRNRRYLYLVVVDGRSTLSRGMTCNELADLMVNLGAWTAMNLDGGGSSTMTVAGLGTVNNPSDGSERVVSNHWAVFASGQGAPEACDLWMDELVVDSGVLNEGRSTDVDGDGKSDFCAKAAAGMRCYLSTGSGFDLNNAWAIPDLSDANGFDQELRFSTIRTGDVNGDGRMDVCARGADGVRCWLSTGTGFGSAFSGPAWSDAAGWNALQHASTLRLADIDGDGRDDFCALAAAGWICHLSTGSGAGARLDGPAWTSANGWNQPYYYGTVRMGDLDGDGRADVCARGAAGMWCALSTGSGFASMFAGPEWSDAAGFTDVAYWSTIRMVDFDHDGRADLCARTPDGVQCHRYTQNGFGPAVAGPQLTDASGWKDMDNSTTIRFADIDGDGDLDICARANAGIRCWRYDGSGWGSQINGPAWDEASGWSDFRFYTTIHLGDIDHDGKADICGRGPDGVRCHLSTGDGFGPEIAGPALTDASGWAGYPYFSTIRFGGVAPVCTPVAGDDATCDGVDDDCDGTVDEDADAVCDDADACNGREACVQAACVSLDAPDCGDRGCLPATGCCPEGTRAEGGICVVVVSCDPDNDTCNDYDRCNGIERCDPETRTCVAQNPLDCGDRGCLPQTGCCPEGTHAENDACVLDAPGGSSGKSSGCSCRSAGGKGGVNMPAWGLLLTVFWALAVLPFLRRRRRAVLYVFALALFPMVSSCASGGSKGPFCGDGKVDAPVEECDPPGVGACDATCLRDLAKCGDRQCQPPENADNCVVDCQPICGNGHRETGEECDGQDMGGASCESLGFPGGTLLCLSDCTFSVLGCESTCGDGVLNDGEACDDRNRSNNDGCSVLCQVEAGWTCTGVPSSCSPVCGDGILTANELCDVGNLREFTCQSEGFYTGELACDSNCLALDTSGCSGYCGDGIRQDGYELCDGSLNGATCQNMGWPGGGPLSCVNCQLDATLCSRWIAVGNGGGHTCAIRGDGSLWCWGFNGDGRIGDGTFNDRSLPVGVVNFSSQAVQASGGLFHTCAVKSTGSAWCWGQGSDGQLGNNSTAATANPAAVHGMSSGVVEVGSGHYHTCARKSDGSVWCWGKNDHGQLGNGTFTNSLTPVPVSNVSAARALAVGGNHTCIIGGAGGVGCWGSNQYGQLGDGGAADRSTPYTINSLASGVVSLSAGSFHTCAVKSDGSAWCWGYNLKGRLGDGTVTNRNVPTAVSGFSSGIVQITAGGHQTCALRDDGSVWCWGANQFGQVGDGTTTDRLVPTAVSGLPFPAAGVFCGGAHVCALLDRGALWCWGNNDSGRLGDGTTTSRPTPVPVYFP